MSKILISGQWLWPHYQEACAKALESLGHRVIKFSWHQHFFEKSLDGDPRFKSFLTQRQNKYVFGPLINRINRGLVSLAKESNPEVVWLYNDTHIIPESIEQLRGFLPGAVFAQYANDNPWGANQSRIMWRHFKRSVPFFDINFYYRLANEQDLLDAGARKTAILRSYYIPEETFPLDGDVEGGFRSDVVFVGHYEADGRLDMIEALAEAGYSVRLFGTGWDDALSRLSEDYAIKKLHPVKPARGEDYRKAICGARIALSFLSKLNEDTYTRRNFEITAMRTFMLSEHSEDLTSLFVEGIEAEFFRSKEEMLSKVSYYLHHEDLLTKIAQRGYERVKKDGHDVTSRMKQFMSHLAKVRM